MTKRYMRLSAFFTVIYIHHLCRGSRGKRNVLLTLTHFTLFEGPFTPLLLPMFEENHTWINMYGLYMLLWGTCLKFRRRWQKVHHCVFIYFRVPLIIGWNILRFDKISHKLGSFICISHITTHNCVLPVHYFYINARKYFYLDPR